MKKGNNAELFLLLKALWTAVLQCIYPFYVLIIRSHTNLPGFLAEGNARADALANPVWAVPQPDKLAQTKTSHTLFHQNARTLCKQFSLTPTEARAVVSNFNGPLPLGVNPRGLLALQLWQTDVTHISEFGRFKYVYVSIDTFSSVVWASAHVGEKAHDVILHWQQAFAALSIPACVKTDNGPAYASQKVRNFLRL